MQIQIQNLPHGRLTCALNGKHYKWRLTTEDGRTNISKKDISLAQQLANKQFLLLQLDDKLQEKQAINAYLNNHSTSAKHKIESLLSHPEYRKLIYPQLSKTLQKSIIWQSAPYQKNPNHPEHLIHETVTGELVRSKSESLIFEQLFQNKIPFRYECLLLLGDSSYYPDFTIMHPKTNELFYWEHFGRSDDFEYRQKAFSKLENYAAHGIIPSIQLITTFETLHQPLSAKKISDIIRQYFL